MVQVTTNCDLKQFVTAIGTNYLPQVHNNRAISDLNFPVVFEFGTSPAESANWKLSLAESAVRRTPIHPNRRLSEVHKTSADQCKVGDELVSSDFKKTAKKHPTSRVSSIYETSRTPLISSTARSICSAPPSKTSTSSARIVVSGRGLISV